jgi:hypothetical protein
MPVRPRRAGHHRPNARSRAPPALPCVAIVASSPAGRALADGSPEGRRCGLGREASIMVGSVLRHLARRRHGVMRTLSPHNAVADSRSSIPDFWVSGSRRPPTPTRATHRRRRCHASHTHPAQQGRHIPDPAKEARTATNAKAVRARPLIGGGSGARTRRPPRGDRAVSSGASAPIGPSRHCVRLCLDLDSNQAPLPCRGSALPHELSRLGIECLRGITISRPTA